MFAATFTVVHVDTYSQIPSSFPEHICHYTNDTNKYYIYRSSAIEEIFIYSSSSVGGSGLANTLALWNNGNTLSYDARITYAIVANDPTIKLTGASTTIQLGSTASGLYSDTYSQFFQVSYSDSAYPSFALSRYRGNRLSNSPALSGDTLGSFRFSGGAGTAVNMYSVASENHTVLTNAGASFYIDTAQTGSWTPITRFKISGSGNITFNEAYTFPKVDGTANQVLTTNGNGTLSWTTISGGGGGTSGSGTLNYLSKWTPDGSTLGNSQLRDDGTNVWIGTVSAAVKFSVSTDTLTYAGSFDSRIANGGIGLSTYGRSSDGLGYTTGLLARGQEGQYNTAIDGLGAGTGLLNTGARLQAWGATENIGAIVSATGSTGTKYSIQLRDGTETAGGGKFLRDSGLGKAQWSTITVADISGYSNELLGMTELSATSLVTYTVPTGTVFQAINLNSDATNRFAKITFIAPTSGHVSVEMTFDMTIVNSAAVQMIGLHTSSVSTNTPSNGWYRVNSDNDSSSGQYYAKFRLDGLTSGNTYTYYFMAVCDFTGNTIRAASQQSGAYSVGTDLPAPLRITAYDLGTVSVVSNPSS